MQAVGGRAVWRAPFFVSAFMLASLAGCGPDTKNQPPVAYGGPDQTARALSEVVLSGRDSYDPDGPVMSYYWKQLSGPKVKLATVNSSTVRFNLPGVDQPQDLRFQLTVTDNRGATSAIQVKVTDEPPGDPNRFLTFFNAVNNYTVQVAPAAGQGPLAAAVNFDLVATSQLTYTTLDGASRTLTIDTQRQPETWTPTEQAASVLPRAGFHFPTVDLRDLTDFNQALRNSVQVKIDVTVENLSSPFDYSLQALDNNGNPISLNRLSLSDNPASNGYLRDAGSVQQSQSASAQTLSTPNGLALDYDKLRDSLGVPVEESKTTAEAYYKAIDPDNRKTTLNDWLNADGFDQGDAVEAKYINGFDLGFGRDMKVRTDNAGDVYAVVTNYPNMDSMLRGINEIATVAMEYSPGPNGGAPFTKFYTFVPDPVTGEEQRVVSMDFDGRGEKYTPGNCAVCHGGHPKALVSGAYPDDGNIGAHFLPWDLGTFAFSDREYSGLQGQENLSVSRAKEETAFKFFNTALLETEPTAAQKDLVQGWYGGPDMLSPVFQGNYIPQGWRSPDQGGPAGNPANASDFYLNVFAPSCRACHYAQDAANSNLGMATYSEFLAEKDSIRNYVFDQGVMPLSRVTMDNFWVDHYTGTAHARPMANQLGIDPAQHNPGKVAAVISSVDQSNSQTGLPDSSSQATAVVARGDRIYADASHSRAAQQFSWALAAPVNSSAALVAAKGAQTAFVPDSGGDFALTLTADDGFGHSSSVTYHYQVPNKIPVAGDFSVATNENDPASLNLLASPTRLGDGTVAQHSVSLGVITGPFTATVSGGVVMIVPTGTGSGGFDYSVSDVDGDASVQPGHVSVTISPGIKAQTDNLTATVGTVSNGRVISFPVDSKILANDSLGTSGSPPTHLTGAPSFVSASLDNMFGNCTRHGSFTLNDQGTATTADDQLIYTPPVACSGSEVWRYTIIDSAGHTSSADVDISVGTTVSFATVNSSVFVGDCSSCHDNSGVASSYPFAESSDTLAQRYQVIVDNGLVDPVLTTLYDTTNQDGVRNSALLKYPAHDLGETMSGYSSGMVYKASCSGSDTDEYCLVRRWIEEGASGP